MTVEYQKNEKYGTALGRYGCQYGESKLRYWQMRLQIQLKLGICVNVHFNIHYQN